MTYPDNLKYTKEHEWIKIDGETALIGVTKYALDQLGDVVYLELPKINSKFKENETFGTIESTKTVSDLFIPITGEVLEVNTHLVDSPENISEDPYDKGWLIKVKVTEMSSSLLSAAEYESYIQSQ